MASKDSEKQSREQAKKDPGEGEQRAKDLKPPKDKGKDVKGGVWRSGR